MEDVELICWDFGNTLVDERWLRRPPPSVPDWEQILDTAIAENADLDASWNLGSATTADLAACVASYVQGMSAAEAEDHLRAASREIDFFPHVWACVGRARGHVRQACVTVNPDLFSEVIVPAYALDQTFDVIVASWQFGSRSKVRLAAEARRALGLDPADLSRTLLIDNKEANIAEFSAAGGLAYLFTTDQAFARDLERGLLPAALAP